ncbi:ABC transporter ATP-binding protein [Devosia sp. Leaf64]|uniref:ABC transporter ATP-binding protein n=1 Tax=Devosia sp. Leaf64 TaxID=1736229 RepID=UPI0009E6D6DC|nr:ABC transporter ATP-binding protein [Devosia sp. Leaf64]
MTNLNPLQAHGDTAAFRASKASAISVSDVSKTFVTSNGRQVDALAQTNIDIERGSFVAVVGRSGCGKSTLLRLLAGLEAPTTGSISINGAADAGRSVRYVFQSYGDSLFPWLTVGKNIEFGLRHAHGDRRALRSLGADARETLVENHLDEVGLSGRASHFPSELSGGMQQRLAIARALASGPDILLLDEPFSAVDALSRANMQDLLLRIWQERKLTVAFVTHDIDEALYLADRVIVMKEHGGGIGEDIAVNLPRPRDQVATRELPEFLAMRRHILELVLRGAQ